MTTSILSKALQKIIVHSIRRTNALLLRCFYLSEMNDTWDAKLNQNKQIKLNPHKFTYNPHGIFCHRFYPNTDAKSYVFFHFRLRKHVVSYFNDSKLYSGVALNLEDGFHAVTVYVGRWTFTKRRNMQIFEMRLLDFSNFLCYIICKFILFFQLT